jgi:hypothetical protein
MVDITTGSSASNVEGVKSFALHVVTVINGVPRDHLVESHDQIQRLLAAGDGFAVVVQGTSRTGNDTVALVDLKSGAVRSLATFNALGMSDRTYPVGGAVSPDGSQIAIGGAHKIVLVQVPSGAVSTLVGAVDSGTWFIPTRWTATGIFAHICTWDRCGGSQTVDSVTGKVTVLGRGEPGVGSPDGTLIAEATWVDLGDPLCYCLWEWNNTLTLRRRGGATTHVISESRHNFTPLDLRDDGLLLFDADTRTGLTYTTSGTLPFDGPTSPDMGLYLAAAGHPVQQIRERFHGEFGSASFLDPTTALVARVQGGSYYDQAGIDVQLVHLCVDTSVACSVITTTVSSTTGTYPTSIGQIIVLPATT